MKILVVDDQPEYLRPYRSTFATNNIDLRVAIDLNQAWQIIKNGKESGKKHDEQGYKVFDLIVIDIAFDAPAREFKHEQDLIHDHLVRRGYGGLAISGQALGLRLWKQRGTLKQPYCYTTNHQDLWIQDIPAEEAEFGGGDASNHHTVIDKASLWPGSIITTIESAVSEWVSKPWLHH